MLGKPPFLRVQIFQCGCFKPPTLLPLTPHPFSVREPYKPIGSLWWNHTLDFCWDLRMQGRCCLHLPQGRNFSNMHTHAHYKPADTYICTQGHMHTHGHLGRSQAHIHTHYTCLHCTLPTSPEPPSDEPVHVGVGAYEPLPFAFTEVATGQTLLYTLAFCCSWYSVCSQRQDC